MSSLQNQKAENIPTGQSEAGWSMAMAMSDCGTTHQPGTKAKIKLLDQGCSENRQYSIEQWLRQPRSVEPWRPLDNSVTPKL
jgi:hypothetical protein